MTRHRGWLIALSLLGGFMPMLSAAATEPREWRFKVLLDEKEVGYYRLRLSDRGTERLSTSEARFSVKFLFVTAYRYEHDSAEVWQDDCLTRIDTRTDANGKQLYVRGMREEAEFNLDTTAGKNTLAGCVMSFAYWNPQILGASRLLNAQTGEYFDVEVKPLGSDPVMAGGTVQPAQRHQLKTAKFAIDLWYSPEGRWLGLESTTEGGKRLRYRLE
jgi:hypothetical protein